MLVTILNGLIDSLVFVITALSALLPQTPFQFAPIPWGQFGKAIGAFIPVASIATHMTLILTAFLTYYAIRWALRLIRQVQ